MDSGAVSWLMLGSLRIPLFTEATNARAIVAVSILHPGPRRMSAISDAPQPTDAVAELLITSPDRRIAVGTPYLYPNHTIGN